VAGASLGGWDRAELERAVDPRREASSGADQGMHPT
jgi:hypothetical protein